MKIKELIKKLEIYDPEIEVRLFDFGKNLNEPLELEEYHFSVLIDDTTNEAFLLLGKVNQS